jgi:hypothetical protein
MSDCSVYCAAFRVMYEDHCDPLLESSKDEIWKVKITKEATQSPHNPFIEDNEIRRGCHGFDCNVYDLYLECSGGY